MAMTTAGAARAGAPMRSGRSPSGNRRLTIATINEASTTARPTAKASFRLATDHTLRYSRRRASPKPMAKVTIRNDATGYQGRVGQGLTVP